AKILQAHLAHASPAINSPVPDAPESGKEKPTPGQAAPGAEAAGQKRGRTSRLRPGALFADNLKDARLAPMAAVGTLPTLIPLRLPAVRGADWPEGAGRVDRAAHGTTPV